DGAGRKVILANGVTGSFYTKLTDFVIPIDRVLTVVPLVTVESAPIQHSGYAAPIVAPTPRFDFVLAATERDHDATIIHQRGRSRWCIPVGILPIKPRTPRVANGTESGKPLFVIEAVEHGLPLVHFVRTDARINLTEIAFL